MSTRHSKSIVLKDAERSNEPASSVGSARKGETSQLALLYMYNLASFMQRCPFAERPTHQYRPQREAKVFLLSWRQRMEEVRNLQSFTKLTSKGVEFCFSLCSRQLPKNPHPTLPADDKARWWWISFLAGSLCLGVCPPCCSLHQAVDVCIIIFMFDHLFVAARSKKLSLPFPNTEVFTSSGDSCFLVSERVVHQYGIGFCLLFRFLQQVLLVASVFCEVVFLLLLAFAGS